MKTIFFSTCTICFFTFILSVMPVHASGENYVLAVPMVEGLENTAITKYLEDIARVLGEKLDANITSKKLVYRYGDKIIDLVLEDFQKGGSHISYINGDEYAEYRLSGKKDLIPLFMLAIDRKTTLQQCVYTKKGKFENIKQLRGTKWAGPRLIPMRYIMYTNGVDEPLDEFFSSINYVTDAPVTNLVEELTNGDIDSFIAYSSVMRISGQTQRKDIDFEPLVCTEASPAWVFVAWRTVPPEMIARIRKTLLNAHKDKDFAAFKFAFQLIDGHFVPVDEKAIKNAETYVKLIEKHKWRAEETAFHKKYHPRTEDTGN